jgi:hypothetical protein
MVSYIEFAQCVWGLFLLDCYSCITFFFFFIIRYGPNQDHIKLKREHAEKLKCLGCRKSDKGKNVYRFAIQCVVGDKDEHKKLKYDKDGRKIHPEDTCAKAWYV